MVVRVIIEIIISLIWYCLHSSNDYYGTTTTWTSLECFGYVKINLPLDYVTNQWVHSIISDDPYNHQPYTTMDRNAPEGTYQVWRNYHDII